MKNGSYKRPKIRSFLLLPARFSGFFLSHPFSSSLSSILSHPFSSSPARLSARLTIKSIHSQLDYCSITTLSARLQVCQRLFTLSHLDSFSARFLLNFYTFNIYWLRLLFHIARFVLKIIHVRVQTLDYNCFY